MLAGVAIDGGGTGMAHAIGHALGTLGHVPHGVAVAAALGAVLAWNVDGGADVYEPVATALRCAVTDVPARFDELLASCRFAEAVRRVGPLDVDVEELALAMVAEENRPMYDNNCRRAGDGECRMLAATTLRRWTEWAA